MTKKLLWIGAAFLLLPHLWMLAALCVYGRAMEDWILPVVMFSSVADFIGLAFLIWAIIRILSAYVKGKI
jgi:hypothetical protein